MILMKTSEKGIKLIKEFESLHDGDLTQVGLQPKMCPAEIWTEGYGHAMICEGKFLRGIGNKELAYKLHTVNTEEEACKLLAKDMKPFEDAVNIYVEVPINQSQFDALVDFAYNLGAEALRKSTLLKKINEGDYLMAAENFSKWNKCNGKILPGLTRRRETEKKLFLGIL